MKNLRATTQITQAGSVIGTFDYAAPEQLNEGAIDARTDVYALGGVLYQALTGKVPYPRETAAATMLAHLDAPPPSVLSVLPDASELLGEVVRRAMAKDPRDRYPSAGDLGRSALGAAQDRRTSTEERSVAAGDAAPDSVLHVQRAAAAPARAVGRDRRRALRRPRAAPGDAGRQVRRGRSAAGASSSCSPASPGSARRGWRPRSPAAPTTRARPCSTAATTRSRCSRTSRSSPRSTTGSPTASSCDLPGELALELTEVARFVPGAAQARAGAQGDARRGARDAPLPALRGRHPAARLRRPRAPGRPAARRPALGRPEHDAAARPPAPGRRADAAVRARHRRARSRASCSPACAARARSRSSS